MATTGQTINDRLNAVRYALVGQGLARTVCKATTEEVLGPKKKHIDYLLACTNEPNVSIPQLANLLIERTQHTSWAVVFKALISIHHLMSYGNERFTQYLATSNHSFELADFMDRTTPQGYNMSTFVRRYAKYINDKSISYRTLAIDLCKIRSGNDNALRTMNMDNLSKTLPIVQQQFDSLLDFAATSKDLNNSVIMSAFRLLYKDVVRLYVAYQEAIINLLERYFKLSRKKTREALEMYKKFLARMDKVASFFQVADAVGLDKSEMPDLTKSPASILNLLEQHLARLEAKKRGTTPQGEDEELDNKENSEQSSTLASQQTKEVEQEKKEEHSGGETSSKLEAKSKEESLQANKTVPPAQKPPPRPSPKTSPLVSPSDSKSPPGSTAKQMSPSSNVSAAATAAAPEKKGPPERPAKPPSRPPPPSAASAPPPPPPPPQQSSGPSSGSSGVASSTKAASHVSPPPPHPPPPQAHHQPPPHPPAPHAPPHPPAPSTSPVPPTTTTTTTTTSATEANSNNVTSNSNSTNNNSNSNNNSADGNKDVSDHMSASAEGPTCSASVVPHNDSSVEQSAQQQVDEVVNHENSSSISHEVETNHINNVSQEAVQEANVEAAAAAPPPPPPPAVAEDELEMPPPPPPIEDIDDSMPEPPPPVEAEEEQAPVEGQPQQQPADISQQQPALNGQTTNGAE